MQIEAVESNAYAKAQLKGAKELDKPEEETDPNAGRHRRCKTSKRCILLTGLPDSTTEAHLVGLVNRLYGLQPTRLALLSRTHRAVFEFADAETAQQVLEESSEVECPWERNSKMMLEGIESNDFAKNALKSSKVLNADSITDQMSISTLGETSLPASRTRRGGLAHRCILLTRVPETSTEDQLASLISHNYGLEPKRIALLLPEMHRAVVEFNDAKCVKQIMNGGSLELDCPWRKDAPMLIQAIQSNIFAKEKLTGAKEFSLSSTTQQSVSPTNSVEGSQTGPSQALRVSTARKCILVSCLPKSSLTSTEQLVQLFDDLHDMTPTRVALMLDSQRAIAEFNDPDSVARILGNSKERLQPCPWEANHTLRLQRVESKSYAKACLKSAVEVESAEKICPTKKTRVSNAEEYPKEITTCRVAPEHKVEPPSGLSGPTSPATTSTADIKSDVDQVREDLTQAQEEIAQLKRDLAASEKRSLTLHTALESTTEELRKMKKEDVQTRALLEETLKHLKEAQEGARRHEASLLNEQRSGNEANKLVLDLRALEAASKSRAYELDVATLSTSPLLQSPEQLQQAGDDHLFENLKLQQAEKDFLEHAALTQKNWESAPSLSLVEHIAVNESLPDSLHASVHARHSPELHPHATPGESRLQSDLSWLVNG